MDLVRMHGGACGVLGVKPTSLFVLYAPERQVDAWLNHARFLGHFMLEVLLRVPGHDYRSGHEKPHASDLEQPLLSFPVGTARMFPVRRVDRCVGWASMTATERALHEVHALFK